MLVKFKFKLKDDIPGMNYPTKKLIVLFCIVLFSAACSGNNPSPTQIIKPVYDYSHRLKIGKEILFVETVSDEKKMQTGLSGRQSLGENEGMLFDFKTSQTNLNFWMKDMLFNIDIIWIADKKIIGITPNVPRPHEPSAQSDGGQASPIKNLPLYSPPSPVTQVLEVNAGWSKKNGIKVGDEVQVVN